MDRARESCSSVMCAPVKSTFCRLAPVKSAPVKTALLNDEFLRLA